jgi:hypothetical protein
VSIIKELFPLPDTPETPIKQFAGKLTDMFFKLFKFALFKP